MTKLSYIIKTPNGNFFEADTYADALKIKSDYPGASMTTCYTPIPEPTHTTAKQLANRVKAY